ncbi:MAG: UDP-glucose/GDP-mannose dehydrogenase family protein [Micrococcaceae bacterium]|nr:UDP-glucose/GDP-mannose dehydrogenase family protein [Micrococcaceae bacterium]
MSMKISVVGTGYLGVTHAACMAELGFEVIGVDVDPHKVRMLSDGQLPFHEPGLGELLRTHVASGRLRFTTDYGRVAEWADVHFIGVGTPQRNDGHGADMRYVDAAVAELATRIRGKALIVGKSTVPVGTARRLSGLIAANANPGAEITLAWNPEFLREGYAVRDTMTPDRLVLGCEDGTSEAILRQVYARALDAGTPVIVTDFETAELVKVAANAFLATKISFINSFAEITETIGGDITVLADALGHDARIGRKFLNAGVGFGGGCLPKDIRALQARTSELGLTHTMGFLAEVDEINLRRRERVVRLSHAMLDDKLVGARVAVLGVSFKPDSDDVRDSPALDIAVRLFNAGADVLVYDPEGNKNAAERFPRLIYAKDLAEAVYNADLVLLLTEWAEFKALVPTDLEPLVAAHRIIDGRNVLSRGQWEEAGWEIVGMGQHYPPLDGQL